MTDLLLISKYKKEGNAEYLGQLYKRHVHLVFGICMKYLKDVIKTEDATMDVFEILLTTAQTANIINFKPWLYTVTKNHCLKLLRSRKYIEIYNDLTLDYFEMDIDDLQSKEDQLDKLDFALDKLSFNHRTSILLFYYQNNSYKAISQKMKWTEKQTKSYLQNAKRQLGLLMK